MDADFVMARPPARPIVLINGEWVNCRYVRWDIRSDPVVPFEALLRAGFQIEGVRVKARVRLERVDGVGLVFEPSGVKMERRASGRWVFAFRNKGDMEVVPSMAAVIAEAG